MEYTGQEKRKAALAAAVCTLALFAASFGPEIVAGAAGLDPHALRWALAMGACVLMLFAAGALLFAAWKMGRR